jgi:hypothetical protein
LWSRVAALSTTANTAEEKPMTLEQFKLCCEKSIRSNFKARNTRVFSSEARHHRIVAERRAKVREYIGALRRARHPKFAPLVSEAVRWKIA